METIAEGLQLPLSTVLRTCSLNCCRLAPVVGFEEGVGKVTRRSVANAVLMAVRKFASGASGSSWIAETVPVRLALAAIESGASCWNAAQETDGTTTESRATRPRACAKTIGREL